jgi:hypothetical protein
MTFKGQVPLRIKKCNIYIGTRKYIHIFGIQDFIWSGKGQTLKNKDNFTYSGTMLMNQILVIRKSVVNNNWASRHEGVLGEWRYSSTHSLTSALDESEGLASRPGRFTPRERAPGTHWIGGWVGPRAVLDAVVKRKIPSPRLELNPRTPVVQPVAQRYTDWAIMALIESIYLIPPLLHSCEMWAVTRRDVREMKFIRRTAR